MKPRVLLVIPNVPFPIVSGGHMRDEQILYALNANGIRPYLLYFGAGEGYTLDPDSPCRNRTADVEFGGARRESPDHSPLAKLRRKLGYVACRFPATHPFAYQYDAISACDRILEYARRAQIDVVILRSFWCHYVHRLRSAGLKVIANCPDYNVLLAWEMVRSVKNPIRKVGPLCNYFGVRRLEEHLLGHCDEVWVPTQREADAMAPVTARHQVLVFPNLINVSGYPDLSGEPGSGATLLFVANYSYLPNENAVRLLLDAVFPAVRRRIPDVKLLLAGKGLSDELTQKIREMPGVEALGFVEDLAAVYRRATLVLLPIREGAGMLFKALEALAFGRPSIGFPHAYRGITPSRDAYVTVPSAAAMSRAIIDLLENSSRLHRLAVSARELAQSSLSWTVANGVLEKSRVLMSFSRMSSSLKGAN